MYKAFSSLFLYLPIVALAKDVLIRGRIPEENVAKRIVCNSDNVLRALKANSASASPFCSSFIDIPVTTTFKSVAGVTATIITETLTSTSSIFPKFPSPLPTYVSQYATSQVSSACSCLSVPTSTDTETASYSTEYAYSTVYTTTTFTGTGPCATGPVYQGAHRLTGQFSDATPNTIYAPNVYECCNVCNSGSQGPYASCVAWTYQPEGGNCTELLEGNPFADYMQPPCHHDGLQPGTIYVDKAKFPAAYGGKGQCASTLTVVNPG